MLKQLFAKLLSVCSCFLLTGTFASYSQVDTTKEDRFSVHGQTTFINQFKPAFKANYSGSHSLITDAESQRSTTMTLFLGARVWNNASVIFNPEVAAGSGLSGSMGVGASTNGETYRIDNVAPTVELARLYFRQLIPLTSKTMMQESSANKLGVNIPVSYLSFTAGKLCIADFFDQNKFSHDPRTQFMSWALMSNGAWDFPANTRGYTPSIIGEWITPDNELRYGFSLLPTTANGMTMNWDVQHAGSHTLEYTHNYTIGGQKGTIRLVSFFSYGNMRNYRQSIENNSMKPDSLFNKKFGHSKYGFGINLEQDFTREFGMFFRASWNDGNNETWAFTEIDHSISAGLSMSGQQWSRPNDVLAVAHVISGISLPHREYLAAGGNGFELGDGKLNYALEQLTECYYSFQLSPNISLSATYQHIFNPGYNMDRGPVNVYSVRMHANF
jgi:high affinity Mn2+ porin